MSGILLDLGLLTADTIVHNARVLFANHCLLSRNQIVQWLADIAVWLFYFLWFFFLVFLASMDYGLIKNKRIRLY